MSVPDLLLFQQDPTACICSLVEDLTPALIDWFTPQRFAMFINGPVARAPISDAFRRLLTNPTRTDEECSAVIVKMVQGGMFTWIERDSTGIYDPVTDIVASGRVSVFKKVVPACVWVDRYAHRLRRKLINTAVEKGHAAFLAYLLDGPGGGGGERKFPLLADTASEVIKLALECGHYECVITVNERILYHRAETLAQLWWLYHRDPSIPLVLDELNKRDHRPTSLARMLRVARRQLDFQFAFSILRHREGEEDAEEPTAGGFYSSFFSNREEEEEEDQAALIYKQRPFYVPAEAGILF